MLPAGWRRKFNSLQTIKSIVVITWEAQVWHAAVRGLGFLQVWSQSRLGTVPALHSQPPHCPTMQIFSGGWSKAQRAAPRESSDPHWLWDQVHNVRDQYTQGIVLSRSAFFLISPSSIVTTLVLTKMWDYFGSTNSSQKWEIKPGV